MRISDWSSDVCSSDLVGRPREARPFEPAHRARPPVPGPCRPGAGCLKSAGRPAEGPARLGEVGGFPAIGGARDTNTASQQKEGFMTAPIPAQKRSEEHTSELQSLMRNSYAVFCLKKKKTTKK